MMNDKRHDLVINMIPFCKLKDIEAEVSSLTYDDSSDCNKCFFLSRTVIERPPPPLSLKPFLLIFIWHVYDGWLFFFFFRMGWCGRYQWLMIEKTFSTFWKKISHKHEWNQRTCGFCETDNNIFFSFSRLLRGQKVKGFVNGSVVVVEFWVGMSEKIIVCVDSQWDSFLLVIVYRCR